eukprot:1057533-Alexandrium_andersonii.AAC.1
MAEERRPEAMQGMEARRRACCDLRRTAVGGRGGDRPRGRHRALEPGEGALELTGLTSPGSQACAASGSKVG